jgi:hypothetical protein
MPAAVCVYLSKELVIVVLLLHNCQVGLRERTYSRCGKHSSRQQWAAASPRGTCIHALTGALHACQR